MDWPSRRTHFSKIQTIICMIVYRNIVVGTYTTGFIGGFISRFSVIFEDFYVSNVTFNGNCAFLCMNSVGPGYVDPPGSLTNVTVRNGIVQNFTENGTIVTSVGSSLYVAYPLFLNAEGPSIFRIYNFTASDVSFNCLLLIIGK